MKILRSFFSAALLIIVSGLSAQTWTEIGNFEKGYNNLQIGVIQAEYCFTSDFGSVVCVPSSQILAGFTDTENAVSSFQKSWQPNASWVGSQKIQMGDASRVALSLIRHNEQSTLGDVILANAGLLNKTMYCWNIVTPCPAWLAWGANPATPLSGSHFFRNISLAYDFYAAGQRTYFAYADASASGRLSVVSKTTSDDWKKIGTLGFSKQGVSEVSMVVNNCDSCNRAVFIATLEADSAIRLYQMKTIQLLGSSVETFIQVGPAIHVSSYVLHMELTVNPANNQPYVVMQNTLTGQTTVVRWTTDMSSWETVGIVPQAIFEPLGGGSWLVTCANITFDTKSGAPIIGCVRTKDGVYRALAMKFKQSTWVNLSGPATNISMGGDIALASIVDFAYDPLQDKLLTIFSADSDNRVRVSALSAVSGL